MRASVFLCLILLACSSEADGPETAARVCDPGKSEACACPSASTGAQVCADDGMNWGECVCEEQQGKLCDTASDCDQANGFECVRGACYVPVVVGGGRACDAPDEVCEDGFRCDGNNCIQG